MINRSIKQLREQVNCAIKGSENAVKMAIESLLGRGNLRIEDVPVIILLSSRTRL